MGLRFCRAAKPQEQQQQSKLDTFLSNVFVKLANHQVFPTTADMALDEAKQQELLQKLDEFLAAAYPPAKPMDEKQARDQYVRDELANFFRNTLKFESVGMPPTLTEDEMRAFTKQDWMTILNVDKTEQEIEAIAVQVLEFINGFEKSSEID